MEEEFGQQLIVAYHHKSDVFEIPWVIERMEMYGPACIPHVRIDGKYIVWGASSCAQAAAAYRSLINQRLTETGGLSPVAIEGAHWVEGDTLRLLATFTLEEPETLIDTRAFLLVLANNLEYGLLLYHHVTQAAYEEDVILDHVGANAQVTAAFAIDPEWGLVEELECIAIIQQMSDSLTVYQSARLPETEAGGIACDQPRARPRILHIAPNPLLYSQGCGEARIQVRVPVCQVHGRALLEVLDQSGRRLRCIRVNRSPGNPGTHTVTWDGRDRNGRPAEAGSYWLRFSGSTGAQAKRLVLIR
ncbi:MAG: hypothetical protein KAY24_07045 [Candidatus Eisenbacteria sp.]|nr:hypothetical protein [Candidatus Eisenbacteria bacterium]